MTYRTPGIYRQDIFPDAPLSLETGVPAFLGYAGRGPFEPEALNAWTAYEERYGYPPAEGYLYHAVRGFFAAGGRRCLIVRLDASLAAESALAKGLAALAARHDLDLICAPDVWLHASSAAGLQLQVLAHCQAAGDRFAILDSPPGATIEGVRAHRGRLSSDFGALYYPWIKVADGPDAQDGFIPVSGHVAGVYARSDAQSGVHKAPANEVIADALDLQTHVSDAQQGVLNPAGVNCLRAFPGRGIRVWGARTLSAQSAWLYVNVRRIFLTAGRWMALNLAEVSFEPHSSGLWARVERELGAYFNDLFRRGALKGASAAEAFFVKCDAETNPPEVRERGEIVSEIGLAAAAPAEFIVVRIIHSESGVQIEGPAATAPAATTTPPTSAPEAAITSERVHIRYIEYNPRGRDVEGEFALLHNRGGTAVDLDGWTLSDRAGHVYTFPGVILPAGGFVRVWTRAGEDGEEELFWGSRQPIWNNVGELALLRDRSGRLIDRFPPELPRRATS